jgi:hypothetical protein
MNTVHNQRVTSISPSRTASLRVLRLLSVFGVGACAACSPSGPSPEDVELAGTSPTEERTWEQWRATVARGLEGKFMVDGDIAIRDEPALRAFYESEIRRNHGSHALTVNRVTSGGITFDDVWAASERFALSYCVANGFEDNQQLLIDALAEATASWEQMAAVDFHHRNVAGPCDQNNDEVMFDVRAAPAGSRFHAQAFFPGDPRASRSLLLSESAFTTEEGGRDLQGILRHELGHALGFRHEHIWIPRCARESIDAARAVTNYDQDSVMHYPECRAPAGGGYRQSALDHVGAIELYGLAAHLIITVGFPI